ncbi:MAG: NAD(P)/FAD-dependent oxidoreductase [Oscillospiraceae bacterium]|nr:NAD(P)/FAD-dependent oxidoreductase [Oscillospiraceae bacterium]
MVKKYFEPTRIGNVYLKNRIIWAPCAEYMQDASHSVSEQQVNYFTARAKGGAGLVCMNSYASDFQDHPMSRLDSVSDLSRFSYLTQSVHEHGAKIALMLSAGRGHKFPEVSGEPPLACSALPTIGDESVIAQEMTTEQVYELIAMYQRSARLAKMADYDFVIIQGYGGYLVDAFMTEAYNKRTDEFGGSFEKRMRFPKLLLKAIREVNGDDFPVIFKMSPVHMIPEGRSMEEGIEVAKILEKEPNVKAFLIDTGCHEVWYRLIPPVWQQGRMYQFEAAKKIKEAVSLPVFTMGKVGDPEEAEAVFNEGMTDFVTVARSFIADPEWAKKVKEDRTEDIIPCICCNEGCVGRVDPGKTLGCAVNPFTGLEGVAKIVEAPEKKKIVVVGAGPAGVEAALVAAKRGHTVELWEKSTKIGGLLKPASSPAFKKELRRLVEYYKAQIYKTPNLRLRLNRTATAENLLEARADAVVIATGATPMVPQIPGVDGKNVHLATDVLQDKKKYGKKCVVIGAGYVGCEAAYHLDYIGKDVTLVEGQEKILPDFMMFWKNFGNPDMNRQMINHLIYEQSSVDVKLNTKLVAVGDGFVEVEQDGKTAKIDCDEVVLAMGYKPNFELEEALAGKVEVITIGDANKVGKVMDAVWSGFAATIAL